MRSIPERIKTDKDILSFARRVKTAFFSGLSFFVVFLIFAGFGLAVAYLMHLVVSIGDPRREPFAAPMWLRRFEPYSVGLFILALLVLAGIEPWKDAYRYFRYGTVEPQEEVNAGETSETDEGVEQAGPHQAKPVAEEKSVPQTGAQANSRRGNRRKRH